MSGIRKKMVLTGIFAVLVLFMNMREVKAAEVTNEYGYFINIQEMIRM